MKLRFFARPGHVLPWPDQFTVGQLRRYVGRASKPVSAETGNALEHPALEEPTVVDSDSRDGRRITRLFFADAADPPLVPADAETAAFLRVPFVPGKVSDGEWKADKEPADRKAAREAARASRAAKTAKKSTTSVPQGGDK